MDHLMNHENVVDKPICLSLNRNWQALGYLTVKQAIIAMTGGLGGTPPALGIAVTVGQDGILEEAIPTKWEDWVKLPVRSEDLSILTKSGQIRVPLIIVRPGYAKMPAKAPKLTNRAILERDGYVCQYTGRKLSRSQLSVDHVIPKARGGKDRWENMVAACKTLNAQKGSKFNHEANLKLTRQPKAPMAVPLSATIKEARRNEHRPFIT